MEQVIPAPSKIVVFNVHQYSSNCHVLQKGKTIVNTYIPETFVWLFCEADWHLVYASAGGSLQYSISHHRSYQPPQRSASPMCRKVKEKFSSESELLTRWMSRGHCRRHSKRRHALEETLQWHRMWREPGGDSMREEMEVCVRMGGAQVTKQVFYQTAGMLNSNTVDNFIQVKC